MKRLLIVVALSILAAFSASSVGLGQGAGVWEKQCVDSSGVQKGSYNSLAYDSGKSPHIAYYDEDYYDLLHATRQNGLWYIETVDSLEDRGQYCSIVIDHQDRPHIAYKAEYTWGMDTILQWPNQTDVVMHAVNTTSGWVTTMVDSMMQRFLWEHMFFTSVNIDANDNPGVAHLALLDSARLTYGHYDGSTWNVQHVTMLGAGAMYVKLLYRGGVDPVIAYLEYDTLSSFSLKLAYWDAGGQQWKFITSPLVNEPTSVLDCDIDPTGTIYVAALGSDDSVRVGTYDWQSWSVEGVYYLHDVGGIINGVSLRIDRVGQPGLAILDSRQVHYLHREAGQWMETFIDEWPVDWWPTDPSLAYDPDNNPGISLCVEIPHPGKSRNGLFYYRFWPGTPQLELADTTHDYGTVWTQSFSNWNCLIRNRGEAPLTIDALQFRGGGVIFQHVAPALPATILPHDSGYVTIRFTPPAVGSYTDTVSIFSTDPAKPVVRIALQGSGGTAGTTADVACEVKSAYIDRLAGRIKSDRVVIGANIALLQNGQLKYGPARTDQTGTGTITGVPVGTYGLRITKVVSIRGDIAGVTSLDTLGITVPVTLGPGANSTSVILPDSIISEAYTVAYELANVPTSAWDTLSTYCYPAATAMRELMQGWSAELPTDAAESGARLIVAGRMVERMFHSGFTIGTEAINDIGELINFLMYSNCWSDSFLDLLKSLTSGYEGVLLWVLKQVIIAFLKDYIVDLVGEGIRAAVAGLPTIDLGPGGILKCPDLVMDVWNDVKDRYIGGTNAFVRALPFASCIINQGAWGATKGDIYGVVRHVFFQLVYVDALTNPSVNKARQKAETFAHTGEFQNAYQKTEDFIADKTESVGVAKDISQYAIVTAKLLQATEQIMGAMATMIPGAGPVLDLLSTIGEFASYAMVGTAVGVSVGTFFELPSSIDNAVDHVYASGPNPWKSYPGIVSGGRGAVMPMRTRRTLQQQLLAADAQYDSTVHAIESHIRTGRMADAVLGLQGLTRADRSLRAAIKMSVAPLYTVAPLARDSIAGFQVMYDSLWAGHARAGMERFKNYLFVATLLADSGNSIKDSVIAQLERSVVQNGLLTGKVSAALDSVASLPLPPLVVFCVGDQDVYTIKPGDVGTVTLRLKNIGGLRADSLRLSFKTAGGIRAIEPEGVSLGSLLPGEESETVTWHLGTYGTGYSRGVWSASISSSNATAYPYSGLLSIESPSMPGTGGRLSSDNIYNYPNPFNPDRMSTTMRYSLATSAQVTIRVYDAGGNLVKNVMSGVTMNADDEQATTWDGKNGAGNVVANGVYFYVVETSAGERAVGKIAVLR